MEFSKSEQKAVNQLSTAVKELRRVIGIAKESGVVLRLRYAKWQRPNWVTVHEERLETPMVIKSTNEVEVKV